MAAPSSSARFLITISAMLAIGTLTGCRASMPRSVSLFAATGVLYPFFGTLLAGWCVALTAPMSALQRGVRKLAEDHLGATWTLADPDGRRQLVRRRDGQLIATRSRSSSPPPPPTGMGMKVQSCVTCSGIPSCWRALSPSVMLQAYVYPSRRWSEVGRSISDQRLRKSPRPIARGICL